MKTSELLDRLLVTLDIGIQNFGVCEVGPGRCLVGAKVDGVMVHYVLEGTLHMDLPKTERIRCGPGSIVLIPPGLQPSMTSDGRPAVEVLAVDSAIMSRESMIVFDAAGGSTGELRMVCGVIGASLSGSHGLLDRMTGPIVEDLSDSPMVRQAYAAMVDEIASPGLGARALTGALMKTCLLITLRRFFSRHGGNEAVIGALANPKLGAAVSAILEQPALPHSVASLAERSGMSRSTFARQFTDAFGTGPMEFVAKTRLHHAADLLQSTKLPIKTIAASIGFASRSHFSRAFRDAYGSDPSQFRKQHFQEPLDAPAALHGSRARFALSPEPN